MLQRKEIVEFLTLLMRALSIIIIDNVLSMSMDNDFVVKKIAICVIIFIFATYLVETSNNRLWLIFTYLWALIATILSVKLLLNLDKNSLFLEFLLAIALYVLPHICLAQYCSYNRMDLDYLKWPLRLILASPILMFIMPTISMATIPYSLIIIFTLIVLISNGVRIYKKICTWRNLYPNWSLPPHLIKSEWDRFIMANAAFWIIRTIGGAFALIKSESEVRLGLMGAIRKLIVDGSDTITAVMGMTGIMALFGRLVHIVICLYLYYPSVPIMENKVEFLEKLTGGVFLMLAIQTGLTFLSPDMRYSVLCENMHLVLIALLHYIHEMVSPLMMLVGKNYIIRPNHSIRATYICWLLWVLAWAQLCYQAITSSWSVTLTAYTIQVILQTTNSLFTQAIIKRKNKLEMTFEQFDKYIGYLKTFGKVTDLCIHGVVCCYTFCNLVIFFNGLPGIFMCFEIFIHTCRQATAGWETLRVAGNSRLSLATTIQKQEWAAICQIGFLKVEEFGQSCTLQYIETTCSRCAQRIKVCLERRRTMITPEQRPLVS